MTPKFSVIIPVHNGEAYLRQAVDSVLAQTYPAHEVIAIDDGSTDSAPEILRSFGDRLIVKRGPNAGVSAARNEGMRMATGDWLAFLDSDDLWFRDKLNKQAEQIRQSPETGLLYCNFVTDGPGPDGLVPGYSLLSYADKLNFDAPLASDPFTALVRENFIACPSGVALSRKAAAKAGEFDTADPFTQDYDYWLRCARVTGIWLSTDILYYKRAHGTNVSGDRIAIYEHHLRTLSKLAVPGAADLTEDPLRSTYRDAVSRAYLDLGNAYFEAGRKAKAFSVYLHGLSQQRTPRNAARFSGVLMRKSFRTLTFGALSRRSVRRVAEPIRKRISGQ